MSPSVRRPAGASPSRRIPARAGALIAVVVTTTTTLAMLPVPGRSLTSLPHSRPPVSYQLPVDDVVVRRFERPAQRWSAGHRGIDIDAAVGTAVRAPADGVVTFSGTVVDRGVLTIEHADGLRSSLEPLTGGPPRWTRVSAGDVVGAVADGGTHCAPADCLHWGVRRGEDYLDPLTLLPGRAPVVLLADLSSGRSPGASPEAEAWPQCASGRCVTR